MRTLHDTENITIESRKQTACSTGYQLDIVVRLSTGGALAFSSVFGSIDFCIHSIQNQIDCIQFVFDQHKLVFDINYPRKPICLEQPQLVQS